jgi:hypothetical protein
MKDLRLRLTLHSLNISLPHWYPRLARTYFNLPIPRTRESDSIQINRLCYNAANMQYEFRFANNNNNNDNDDLRIVGRSLAG